MKINVTDYVVDGENKTNSDVLDFNYNENKWGLDFDVIRSWVEDECFNVFGVNLKSFHII